MHLSQEKENSWKEQEGKLQKNVAALEGKVSCMEAERKSKSYHRCAECEVFQTIVEQLRKERDGLRTEREELKERSAAAQTKVKTLQAALDNHKRDYDSVERSWKTKSQKTEKELKELRLKISKMEEGTARIVQEKVTSVPST